MTLCGESLVLGWDSRNTWGGGVGGGGGGGGEASSWGWEIPMQP